MKNISEIDTNFKIKPSITKDGTDFFDVNLPPFEINGVFYEDNKFRRMPEAVAKTVSEGVHFLHANTAGGRVRFKTDSSYIAIIAKMPFISKTPHFALTGSAGFDLYVDEKTYINTFAPPFDAEDGFESVIELGATQMRDITINFPLYSDVSELYIGISNNAKLCPPQPYEREGKIVYYGSSITQGGCASRPGSAYQSIVSRRFGMDYVNLGFSGNAKAEDEIIEYIKKLPMSVFVLDYDHNAPTTDHLRNTHEKMYQAVREENPDLPIIMMSRPKVSLDDDEKIRLEIIKETYNKAKAQGDNNVYFIDGKTLMSLAQDEGTVDHCHPTDLGFFSMAKAVGDVLENILK